MSEPSTNTEEKVQISASRRYMRWGLAVLAVIGLAWLAAWLVQRSFQTPNRKRSLQSWMDEKLNADVSLLGGMTVRTNLVRDSRLVLRDIEIEHPNPVFPGRFARIGRLGFWVPPWSVVHLYPGRLDMLVSRARFSLEQSDFGEWSYQGLMQPLAAGNTRFPFPMPSLSSWNAVIEDSSLLVRRRGYELQMRLDCDVSGRTSDKRIAIHNNSCEFTFGKVDESARVTGVASPITLRLRLGDKPDSIPELVPGRCSARVRNVPLSALPFFLSGIPMDSAQGSFQGMIRYDEYPDALGALLLEGELNDAPLSALGLPRNSPIRLTWPIQPKADNLQARVHMGPSGFGAFEINVPLDAEGWPKQLGMRGDIVDLDVMPAVFGKYSRWPDWLTRIFPSIHLRTGSWRGFGWRGENLQLSLTRSTAGMNLFGEGEMMGGKIRLSMSPDQADAPVTVAAERLDPVRLSFGVSRLLPKPFQVRINGTSVNLTWRGYPSQGGSLEEWGTGMVWAKPIIDASASGEFWRGMSGIARAVADALPEWGGGRGIGDYGSFA